MKKDINAVVADWLLALTAFAILAGVLHTGVQSNRAYNSQVCSVYGYQADCHTPMK
jgi:hypothetical protein